MCCASEHEMKCCCLIMAKTANDSFMFLQLWSKSCKTLNEEQWKNRGKQNLKASSLYFIGLMVFVGKVT